MPVWGVSVLSDSGREWDLTDDPKARVAISGMSGMVAKSAETRSSVAGRPGSRRVASRVDSLAPSWTLEFIDRDGSGLGEDVAEWLAAWQQGVTVSVESSMGRLSTRGSLPEDYDVPMDLLPTVSRVRWGTWQLPWSWVADRAVWEQSYSGSGEALIVNYGDAVLSPTLLWSGAGQSVTIRGVTTQLPTVSEYALMVLDHAENCEVTDTSGNRLDGPSDWSRKQALNLSVVIPPKKTETITVTEGVQVSWSVGVKSPWR